MSPIERITGWAIVVIPIALGTGAAALIWACAIGVIRGTLH